MTDWHGVYPAVTTKFNPDLSLDHGAMRQHFARLIEAGVDGLITTGSLGEAGALSIDEKLDIAATAVDVSGGRVPVLATVCETTTAAACAFVKAANGSGIDGYMVLPGMLYPADRRETVAHYAAVAAASDHPMMIYNNPVSYRIDIDAETLAELAAEPGFVAIKESSDDVRRITVLHNRFGDRFRLFTGVDNLALESLFMGAVGWVAGLVNAFPEETVAVYRLQRAGRAAEALALYRWFVPVLDLDVSTKLVQNIKLAEAITGLGTETVRPPRLPLDGAERAGVEALVREAIARRPALPDWRSAAE